jgi:hypothetical protein
VLVLATLGDMTQIGSFLFFVMLPKLAKPRTNMLLLLVLSVALSPTHVTNGNEQSFFALAPWVKQHKKDNFNLCSLAQGGQGM